MKQIIRFFHIRAIAEDALAALSTKGGATVAVTSLTDKPGKVLVQRAMCSAGDAFCRKEGRSQALAHPAVEISLDGLPAYLQSVAKLVTRDVLKLSRKQRVQHHLWNTDYEFAKKYFTKQEAVAA